MSDTPKVRALFERARNVPLKDRLAFVLREAGDDADLANEVLSLLGHLTTKRPSKEDDAPENADDKVSLGNDGAGDSAVQTLEVLRPALGVRRRGGSGPGRARDSDVRAGRHDRREARDGHPSGPALPGGTFLQGAQKADEKAHNYDPRANDHESDDGDPVSVTLRPFFISKYEMTQGQ